MRRRFYNLWPPSFNLSIFKLGFFWKTIFILLLLFIRQTDSRFYGNLNISKQQYPKALEVFHLINSTAPENTHTEHAVQLLVMQQNLFQINT